MGTTSMLEPVLVSKLFGVGEVSKFPRTKWIAYYPRNAFKKVPIGWMKFKVQ